MLATMLFGCVEPVWTDARVNAVMKAAAGPSAISRSVIAILQDCEDNGVHTTNEGTVSCTVNDTEDGDNVLYGSMTWSNEVTDGESSLLATFDGVILGSGEHSAVIDGAASLPLSPGGELVLDALELSLTGDPFEHWTEVDNEFLFAIAPVQFTYTSWKGDASVGGAWTTGHGNVRIDDDHDVKLGAWAQGGPPCFDSLPATRFEVEDGTLDLTIEPTDWDQCTACWTWHTDGGESGEVCLNDVV